MDDLIARFERHSILFAQSTERPWKEVRTLLMEMEHLEKPSRLYDGNAAASVWPLYASTDDAEVSAVFAPIGTADEALIFGILNAIAESAATGAPIELTSHAINWLSLLSVMGEAIVAPAFAALRDAIASLYEDHVRHELHGDTPATAPIGTDDLRFEEAGLTSCDPSAEHATRVIRADIDDDLVEPLRALVHTRADAAKRVLRGGIGLVEALPALATHSPAPMADPMKVGLAIQSAWGEDDMGFDNTLPPIEFSDAELRHLGAAAIRAVAHPSTQEGGDRG